jgi:hypothetical protein
MVVPDNAMLPSLGGGWPTSVKQHSYFSIPGSGLSLSVYGFTPV